MSEPSAVLDLTQTSSDESGTEVGGNTSPPPPPTRNIRSRGWCFTINNPTQPGANLMEIIKMDPRVTYCVFSLEQGEQGTRHFQGYLHFEHAQRMQAAKDVVGQRAHLEKARGTPQQNRRYCVKEPIEGPWEHGEMPTQGKRNDLTELIDAIKAGHIKSFLDAVESEWATTALRNMKQVERMIQLYAKAIDAPPDVVVRWGSTGVGKSRGWRERFPGQRIYSKKNSKWWDGYQGEDIVIWDEFSDSTCPIEEWLQLTDRYRSGLIGEIKGGHVAMTWTKICFTSNLPPHQWWVNARPDQLQAVQRRITLIEHVV